MSEERKKSKYNMEEDQEMEYEDGYLNDYEQEEDYAEDAAGEEPEVKEDELVGAEYYLKKMKGLDSGKYYLSLMKEFPLLTKEQEIEIARKIKQGDTEARNLMVQSNLRLVVALAKRQNKDGQMFEDLIQEGNLGLIRAANKFDPEKGFRFSTYATWWIKQAMSNYINNMGQQIRIPQKAKVKFNQSVKDLHMEMSVEGKTPTVEDIADRMGTTAQQVNRIINAAEGAISLDAKVSSDDEKSSYHEQLADESIEDVENKLAAEEIKKLLQDKTSFLGRKEKIAMFLYYGFSNGLSHTYEEVGDEYNMTRERARQIIEGAILKIKAIIPKELREDYL